MKSQSTSALLAAVLGIGVYAGNVMASSSPGVTPKILAKAGFGQIDVSTRATGASLWRARVKTRGNSDVYVVDNQFAKGATTGWHSHPGPSLILVLSGAVTNHTGDGPGCAHTYTTGQGFIDPGGEHVHMLTTDINTTAETIAVQLLPKDAARKIEAVDPGNCQPDITGQDEGGGTPDNND
jgi:quercetin dioxygenase-like cupin family protein